MTVSIRLKLQPSRQVAGIIAALHLAAICSAVFSLSGWALLLATAGIVASGLASVSRLWCNPPGSAYELELHEGRALAWRDAEGDWHHATATFKGCIVSWMIVLALIDNPPVVGSRSRWMIIGSDSADADALRALRSWFRGHSNASIH